MGKGIVWINSASETLSLMGSNYENLTLSSGCKTLYVKTATYSASTITYGLTTDTSASVYSPTLNVSGTPMWVARQFAVETTSESYHTTTRVSTVGTSSGYTQTKTINVTNVTVGYEGNIPEYSIAARKIYTYEQSTYTANQQSIYLLNSASKTLSATYSFYIPFRADHIRYRSLGTFTCNRGTVTVSDYYLYTSSKTNSSFNSKTSAMIKYTDTVQATNGTGTLWYCSKSIYYSKTGTYTITTSKLQGQVYVTTESEYTSRTETLTVTITTNNAC